MLFNKINRGVTSFCLYFKSSTVVTVWEWMGVGCPFYLYIWLILCSEDSGMNQSQIILFKSLRGKKNMYWNNSYKSHERYILKTIIGSKSTVGERIYRPCVLSSNQTPLFGFLLVFSGGDVVGVRIFYACSERLSRPKQINVVNTYLVSTLSLAHENTTSLVQGYDRVSRCSDGLGVSAAALVSILSLLSNITFGD